MAVDQSRSRPWTVGAGLLVLSGVTHVAQLAFYQGVGYGAAAFGVVYFILGIALLRRSGSRALAWLAVVLPTIGGVIGLVRLFELQPNPFSAFHVALDLVIVPCFVMWLHATRRPRVGHLP